ncbi:MAG: acetyl-CoA carboxylase biotin carboxyl carrier protein [Proteobacteria bacterium]|nr:acetyl-CoA carboxylase biotin carboxyl carrier protein [Pseudomonadota bacterium]MBT5065727.1 acetyl-CoA carboxylase biotin carboxyl carrier protein [Pseudomonadota bacterium]MBT6192728.1 acetyl-CoA carboxylase biotin carboxyl carrier protein [Pseudomonadota bacterium]MBT6465953.1 acetyl-CoA carboxylase biotin carboxyl carrier protein [Pseudomonadota bacterium]MBT6674471.1 acetyl-CoA carboxylase biotin carboxyl carrier protein [Pseudomonadota bacterium]
MDIRKVKKLIELLEESGIAEIEIHEGEESVRISRGQTANGQTAVLAPPPIVAAPAVNAPTLPQSLPTDSSNHITSPMVGTFYAAASPESAPFVTVGQTINIGDTLCIIEAMKIMNPIEAEVAGTVVAIIAQNGSPVEYGQPLFLIS